MSGGDAGRQAGGGMRPLVARRVSQRGLWLFAGAALLGGVALFAALEHNRAVLSAPAIAPQAEDDMAASVGAQAPELVIPRDPQAGGTGLTPSLALAPNANQAVTPVRIMTPPAPRMAPAIAITPPSVPMRAYDEVPRSMPAPASSPEVVFDAARSRPAPSLAKAGDGDGSKGSERVRATQFANPATTVPKGTVIQAVLESALDSTRAGLARAIISRDVYAFDGGKVLIPKGSRLIGEYKADLALGQSRALIQWQRLMRPDGAMIELDSPSADPLGRAGVKGKVNGHFISRYGGAILQTALDIGQQVAVNQLAPGQTIYALPNLYPTQGGQSSSQAAGLTGQNIQPTLTVKQGTSVSVFVAKDLDFSNVE